MPLPPINSLGIFANTSRLMESLHGEKIMLGYLFFEQGRLLDSDHREFPENLTYSLYLPYGMDIRAALFSVSKSRQARIDYDQSKLASGKFWRRLVDSTG